MVPGGCSQAVVGDSWELILLQALEAEPGLQSLFVQRSGEVSLQENESNPSPAGTTLLRCVCLGSGDGKV